MAKAKAKKAPAKKAKPAQKTGGGPLPKFAGRKARGRAKRTPGTMNNLELAYSKLLEEQRLDGHIIAWEFEPMNIRVAKPQCFYKPDFLVITKDGFVEFHETKGNYFEHDSIVRTKVVANKFPYFIFRLVRRQKVKDGGGWVIKVMGGKFTDEDEECLTKPKK